MLEHYSCSTACNNSLLFSAQIKTMFRFTQSKNSPLDQDKFYVLVWIVFTVM